MYVMGEIQNTIIIMGALLGFLVAGTIGIFVGETMVQSTNLEEGATLSGSQTEIIETFTLGIALCKIIVIVSVAGMVFTSLRRLGFIPMQKEPGGF